MLNIFEDMVKIYKIAYTNKQFSSKLTAESRRELKEGIQIFENLAKTNVLEFIYYPIIAFLVATLTTSFFSILVLVINFPLNIQLDSRMYILVLFIILLLVTFNQHNSYGQYIKQLAKNRDAMRKLLVEKFNIAKIKVPSYYLVSDRPE